MALALQGGGAHGAFAWGVLDRLLEEGLCPLAISGVSSGAILGTLLAQGWVQGGPQGARCEMRLMWDRITEAHHLLAWLWGWLWGWDITRSAMWWGLDMAARVFGPAQINPSAAHPCATCWRACSIATVSPIRRRLG